MATTQQVVTLLPGEVVVLPSNIRIITAATDGDVQLTSSCDNLPDTEEYMCYDFGFAVSDDLNGDAALGDEAGSGPFISYIQIGDTQYELEYDLPDLADGGGDTAADNAALELANAIEDVLPFAIFGVVSVRVEPWENRTEYLVRIRTLPSLVDSIKMVIHGIGFPFGLTLFPVPADCECWEEGTGDVGEYCGDIL